jgi:hypothetical protein
MTDIVERARSAANWSATHGDLLKELAAEIERLQALKTPASAKLLNITKAALDSAEAEIERLQADG